MKTARVAKPLQPFSLSWGLAGAIAGAGAILLAVGIVNATRKPPVAEALADKDTATYQAAIDKLEADTAALRATNKPLSTEYQALLAENKDLESRNADRSNKVRELEAQNRKGIDAEHRKLEDFNKKDGMDQAALDAAAAKVEESRKRFKKFQEDLPKLRNAIVTVVAANGGVGTGCIYSTPTGPVIVTTNKVAPQNTPLAVKVRRDKKTLSLIARVAVADTDTGLAILSVDKPDEINAAVFSDATVREALAGENCYAIATEVIDGEMLEFSIVDGTVSNVARKQGARTLLQAALPINKGVLGAPLVGADLKLLGVMLAPVEDLERTSVAIHAKDIAKALSKLDKKK